MKTTSTARLALLPAGIFLSAQHTWAQFGRGLYYEGRHPHWLHLWHVILFAIIGAIFGAFFSQKARRFRKYVWLTLFVLCVAVGVYGSDPIARVIGFAGGFVMAYMLLRAVAAEASRDTTFGSAQWADFAHLQKNGLVGSSGLMLGCYENDGQLVPLHYTGERHLMTVGPTRSNKGVCAIVPNLLTFHGSALIVDVKGENALITAARRGKGDPVRNIPGMGQDVHIVDPWGITGMPVSRFNPMDWLDPNDPDISENALMLADSLVVPQHGSTADPFWDNESRALGMGLMLFVAIDPDETDRSLGRVRDIIVMDGDDFDGIMARMLKSPNPIVSSTAARTINKDPKLRAGVLASLQSHTHFLDSPRIRESLSHSDFKFENLKTSKTKVTVYLVLPADRLQTFGRWLRLLIQQAITVNARNIAVKPDKPILFLLDEMPALNRLQAVEQAYSLMAGFGMMLWGICQDASQLAAIYPAWETFIGNSGVLQYFGSRDQKTAEYFSKLCGVTTIRKFSFSRAISHAISSAVNGGSTTTNSNTYSYDVVQRQLAFPDELMVMRRDTELLLIENFNPIAGRKVRWFNDERLKHLGVNLHTNKGRQTDAQRGTRVYSDEFLSVGSRGNSGNMTA